MNKKLGPKGWTLSVLAAGILMGVGMFLVPAGYAVDCFPDVPTSLLGTRLRLLAQGQWTGFRAPRRQLWTRRCNHQGRVSGACEERLRFGRGKR